MSKPRHPLLTQGLLWVGLEFGRDLLREILCEIGLRRCSEACWHWRKLQRDIEREKECRNGD